MSELYRMYFTLGTLCGKLYSGKRFEDASVVQKAKELMDEFYSDLNKDVLITHGVNPSSSTVTSTATPVTNKKASISAVPPRRRRSASVVTPKKEGTPT